MGSNLPIGVFDSGVGGLTVFRQLRKALPNEDIIYFGDTKRTPYGSRSNEEIVEFINEILSFMENSQVKLAIAACNTITVLLDQVKKKFPFKIIGMSKGVRTALSLTRNNSIGIIATEATIRSGKHLEEFRSFGHKARVFQQACPRFAPFVENEQFDGLIVEKEASEYLTPIIEADVDVLVLACTHYPLIAPVISKVVGSVHLLDPAQETALEAKSYLENSEQLSEKGLGQSRLYFSADVERARRIASRIIDVNACEFGLIDVSKQSREFLDLKYAQ